MNTLSATERNQMRDKVTKLFAGVHMNEPLWEEVSLAFEWDGVWPVIDADFTLTGEVVDPQDWDYFPHWPSWDAVIHKDVAKAAGWTIDRDEGRAIPPQQEDE